MTFLRALRWTAPRMSYAAALTSLTTLHPYMGIALCIRNWTHYLLRPQDACSGGSDLKLIQSYENSLKHVNEWHSNQHMRKGSVTQQLSRECLANICFFQ